MTATIRDIDEQLVLVDERDREIGTCEKLKAHHDGRLHRAFSVFIFDASGELLLQRRAAGKYHSGGLWSNTCCGHPRPGEPAAAAAARRLREEMGFSAPLRHRFSVTYELAVGTDLYEHEYNHVFTGSFDESPQPDPGEVQDWRWASPADILADMRAHESKYTAWFRVILPQVLAAAG
ncbi:MAG: isopentenyl-diphosphate Delta-isomerase [Acidobacteriota bacterium]|jgi:isopentenyl-diphosphate delta-isomerase